MPAPKPWPPEVRECRDKQCPGSPSNRVWSGLAPILELEWKEVEMQCIPLLFSTTRDLNRTLP